MKNYDAIVKADWEQITENFRHFVKTVKDAKIYSDYSMCQADGIHAPFPITDKCFKMLQRDEDFCSTASNIDRDKVAEILVGFPQNVVNKVCKKIMPLDYEKLWTEKGFHFFK